MKEIGAATRHWGHKANDNVAHDSFTLIQAYHIYLCHSKASNKAISIKQYKESLFIFFSPFFLYWE